MGEVFRARDTKLNRDVAIKVLLPAVANDPDRLARFSREAQVLASLNHPNIAHIHGLEESGGVTALVLELVEGEDLTQRIARGPLPLDEALPIARQIAEALEAAHDHGVIHRDLKPANIKLRADGTVKVLDFGLAKAVDPTAGSSTAAMNSPTLSIHATEAGIILGTAAYMSPEQARGKAVDRRADIWAFGAVLFEMLTGKRAFAGADISDTLVSVLRDDPDWSALPPTVPFVIGRLLRKSLEKDPKRRFDSAAGLRIDIDDAATPVSRTANASNLSHVPIPPTPWSRWLPWGVAVIALVAGGTLAWRAQDRVRVTPIYATLDAPADTVLGEDDRLVSLPTRTPMVFTPDGRSLIIQAARDSKPELFLRSLDRADARPIAGTDEGRVPFVSPDGKWLGFFAANEIRKVPIEGGAPTTVCALNGGGLGPYGAAWGIGDIIVFGDELSGRIMRVPASGGTPAPVTAVPSAGRRHSTPYFLPDGKRILFSDVTRRADVRDSRLMVQSLDGGEARVAMASAVDGRLLPSGHLVFMRLGTLMTVPFDADRAEVTGDASVAMGGVMQSALRPRAGADHTGAGMFAVSSLGTLAFVRGSLIESRGNVMTWVTRDGQSSTAEPVTGDPDGSRLQIRISPDQSRAIVGVVTPTHRGLWLADWTRDTWTECGGCQSEFLGVWSPDGTRLLFGRNDTLVAHRLDGSAPDEVLIQEPGRVLRPGSWLADGRIAYQSSPDEASAEIKVLERGSHTGRVVVPLGTVGGPEVSPDGRWLAYDTAPTDKGEVVVQAFPGSGARLQISAGGGNNPVWSADGRTLYYLRQYRERDVSADALVAVELATSPGLTAGKPRELFRRSTSQRCTTGRCYDVAADGRRFLMRDRSSETRASVTRMDLVLNWTSTLPRNP